MARDVLWNGAFSESEVCVEYYAGLLAASRSADGLDDEAAPFVDAVKSRASRQLKLHYGIYRSLERILEEAHANGEKFDVFGIQGRMDVFVSGHQPDKAALDLQVLMRNGLISEFATDSRKIHREGRESLLFFCRAKPTLFGTTLYAAAHNQLEWCGRSVCGALASLEMSNRQRYTDEHWTNFSSGRGKSCCRLGCGLSLRSCGNPHFRRNQRGGIAVALRITKASMHRGWHHTRPGDGPAGSEFLLRDP